MDEIYDVIDNGGRKNGDATSTECHMQGLLHQTPCILIFKNTSKQEALLQRRNTNIDQVPGLLQHSAGGHMLAGETPEEGIRKEVSEELFVDHEMPDFSIKKISTFFN